MYNIEFYSASDGTSELWDFLENLQKKALTSKDARIQHKQIAQYIQLLADHGTQLGDKITKHLEDDIWELRPGNTARSLKKLLVVKLKRQRLNATIGNTERGDYCGNMERLQKTCQGNKPGNRF